MPQFKRSLPWLAVCAACAAWTAPPAAAQQPDAGSLLRELRPLPAPPAPPAAAVSTPAAPRVAGPAAATVTVSSFRLTGVRLLPEAALQAALAPYRDRPLSFEALQQAADAVAAVYSQQGYLVRAQLPPQDLASGVLTIAVIEGRLADVRTDLQGGGSRLREATAQRFMLARQQLGQPLRADHLQRGINLLNDLPGVQADLVLEPGAQEGESRAVVRLRDKPLVSGVLQADNVGVRSTGSARLLANLALDGALGLGDQAALTALKTTHSSYARLGAGLPLGGDGLRLGLAASALRYAYDADGRHFDGDAKTLSASAIYPLVRGNARNLNLLLNADHKRFGNRIAGVVVNDKTIRLGTVTLSGDQRDDLGGGGYWAASLGLGAGRLNLSGNASDLAVDQAGAGRQGSFSKLALSLARLQQIDARHSAWLSVNGQAANKNLDSAEKTGLGGSSGVRAYGAGAASGDNGWLLTAEWRWAPLDTLQLSAFYDRGGVQRDRRPFAGTAQPNTLVVAGAGVGLRWIAPQGINLSASAAWPVQDNKLSAAALLAADGTRSAPRVWLTLSKSL